MTRKFFFLFTACLFSLAMQAQTVVNGTVVDNKGNVMSGVKVSRDNGTFTTTDLDGKFEIEAQNGERLNFDCVGLNSLRKKSSHEMKVVMKHASNWNSPFNKRRYFAGVQYAETGSLFSKSEQSYGLMFGTVKKNGWYVKAVIPTYIWHGDDLYRDCILYAGAGFLWNVYGSLYMNCGLGFLSFNETTTADITGNYYFINNEGSSNFIGVDLGLNYRLKRFIISAGMIFNVHNHETNRKITWFSLHDYTDYHESRNNLKINAFDAYSFNLGLSYIF